MGSATDLYRDSHAQTGSATFQAVLPWVSTTNPAMPSPRPSILQLCPLQPNALKFGVQLKWVWPENTHPSQWRLWIEN